MVPAVFSGKYGVLDGYERRCVLATLLKMCDEENVVVALAAIARSPGEPAAEIVNYVLDAAIFSRDLGLKARVMRAFPVETLAVAHPRLRVAFFSEIVDIMRPDQYDEVNVITPAVVGVQAAMPKELWAVYVKALESQAKSRAFRGKPAAVAGLARIGKDRIGTTAPQAADAVTETQERLGA